MIFWKKKWIFHFPYVLYKLENNGFEGGKKSGQISDFATKIFFEYIFFIKLDAFGVMKNQMKNQMKFYYGGVHGKPLWLHPENVPMCW